MNIIICIGQKKELLFNKRRVSRDREIIKRIIQLTNEPIYMTEYSAKLFTEYQSNIIITANPLEDTPRGRYCFIEQDIDIQRDEIEQIVVFCWNKRYPADTYLTFPLADLKLIDTEEFAGYSHERITKERYL